ncbi:hypothetical protein ACN28S_08155 [Cystobacter fuscus]
MSRALAPADVRGASEGVGQLALGGDDGRTDGLFPRLEESIQGGEPLLGPCQAPQALLPQELGLLPRRLFIGALLLERVQAGLGPLGALLVLDLEQLHLRAQLVQLGGLHGARGFRLGGGGEGAVWPSSQERERVINPFMALNLFIPGRVGTKGTGSPRAVASRSGGQAGAGDARGVRGHRERRSRALH